MAKKTVFHHKLVRDKIPDIIEKQGKYPLYRTLKNEEYAHYLKLKLLEESYELFQAQSKKDVVSEIADVLEVLHSMAGTHGIGWAEIEEAMSVKNQPCSGQSPFCLKEVFL